MTFRAPMPVPEIKMKITSGYVLVQGSHALAKCEAIRNHVMGPRYEYSISSYLARWSMTRHRMPGTLKALPG